LNKEQHKKLLIVIGGPTASGKTSIAIKLAKMTGAEIISADSRQVYKEMSIGTAKPDIKEMDGVKHHFISNVSIHDEYNVGKYEKEVVSFLDKYFKTNDIAILVGGTGLYINAVLNGLNEFPEVAPEIKEKLNLLFQQHGIFYLQEELKKMDSKYYDKVDLDNPHRLIRALSVIYSGKKPYSFYLDKEKPKRKFESKRIMLDLPRELLYERINNRVDIMLENGLENEARELFELKHLKALQTVGYSELFNYFEGNIDRETAIDLVKRNSRRYAKRQLTWFRNKGDWKMISPNSFEKILEYLEL